MNNNRFKGFNSSVKIADKLIGADHLPYVIAELSANHNGSIERAFAIMRAAKAAGADAIKLQTYTQDTITLKSDSEEFMIRGGLWDGQSLYDLYQQAHMPWDWHKPLFDYAKQLNITIFSSPFDATAVDLLESLNAPAYKVASFEMLDIPLIERIAATKKPMIVSTGMANRDEIDETVDAIKSAGCQQLILLHCVSGYPAPAGDYNLRTLADMAQRYQCPVGLSDHTIDNATAVAAVALGASVIEKHVTLDRNGGGADDSFSLEPAELTHLCRDAKIAWQALGCVSYEIKTSEKNNIQFRRSLYFVKKLNAGDIITPDCVRSVRPGFGLAPKHAVQLIGRRVSRAVDYGTAVTWATINDD
ncbi:MAG: pseudaminic acid synthase [Marinagarivorans sp.]|nr:pseudaminic acid synthase [Marinagarivorans sp.]